MVKSCCEVDIMKIEKVGDKESYHISDSNTGNMVSIFIRPKEKRIRIIENLKIIKEYDFN